MSKFIKIISSIFFLKKKKDSLTSGMVNVELRAAHSPRWSLRGLPFCGENDNEYVLEGVMRADNYWLFCDHKERLVCMVNDVIEELLDLDLEPKPQSLWWTRTCQDEQH